MILTIQIKFNCIKPIALAYKKDAQLTMAHPFFIDPTRKYFADRNLDI